MIRAVPDTLLWLALAAKLPNACKAKSLFPKSKKLRSRRVCPCLDRFRVVRLTNRIKSLSCHIIQLQYGRFGFIVVFNNCSIEIN
jgi:hypothetical protein